MSDQGVDSPGGPNPASGRARNGSASSRKKGASGKRHYLPAQERRQGIIEAAQKVFSRTTLQGARTRDLAKAAGINQATLYEHFESKEELFIAAVVNPLVEAMQGMYERAETYENASTEEELMAAGLASTQRHLETMIEIYPLLSTALFSDPELGKKLYREHIAPLMRERGKAVKGFVKDIIDPELLSVVAFGMFFAVAMERTLGERKRDLSRVALQVARLMVPGMARNLRRSGKAKTKK